MRAKSSAEVQIPLQPADACCGVPAQQVDREQISQQVKLLAALADPTRLQIITMLAGLDEPLCVCDIVSQFDLLQPTISHHLKVLRDAQLVEWEKRGLWVYYALNRKTLALVSAQLNGLLTGAALGGAIK